MGTRQRQRRQSAITRQRVSVHLDVTLHEDAIIASDLGLAANVSDAIERALRLWTGMHRLEIDAAKHEPEAARVA
jgi:Arc/MetJ-type ribon-helix-helix transcriptional regulator